MTTKAEILKTIRAFCMGCSSGSRSEVANCLLTRCPLYPYRFGMDPNPSKPRGIAKRASRGKVFRPKSHS